MRVIRPAQFSSWLSPQRQGVWNQGQNLEPWMCMTLNMELQLLIDHSHVSEMPQIGSESSCFSKAQSILYQLHVTYHYHYHRY